MTNPYISCALGAALAAKNFNFLLIDESAPRYVHNNWMDIIDSASDRCWAVFPKFYIADESLPLLEPQDWDLGIDKNGRLCVFGLEKWNILRTDADQRGIFVIDPVSIIFRNFMPFPKIEWEE
jgi:hypothetical protein